MLVKLVDVGFEWYGNVLFQGFTETVNPGDKIGLIGRNGAGKTTLLRLIHGSLEPTEGEIERARHIEIGFHEQFQSEATLGLSVWEAVRNGLEGRDADRKTRSLLKGVGLDEDQWDRPLGTLSGGESTKLDLARLLSKDWSLLLLDEPTNYLDIANVEWLVEYLDRFRGALIVVSHDRHLLKAVCNTFWEISTRRIWSFRGNFERYLKTRELVRKANTRRAENLKKEIERQKRVIETYRRWNREKSLKQARSREKMVARLEEELSKVELPETNRKIPMALPNVERSDFKVLVVEGLGVQLNGRSILENVHLEVNRGEKVTILGRNGTGKTTFLKALNGDLPHSGRVEWGEKTKRAFVDQMLERLDPSSTILEQAWSKVTDWPDWRVRAYLGRFGFIGDEIEKTVGELSGGERTRLALALAILDGPNVLILDEPTNHMDLESIQVLEGILKEYEGTLLMVSHDRSLVESVCDKILAIFEGSLVELKSVQEYLEHYSRSQKTWEKASENREDFQRLKKLKNRVKSLKRRLEALEGEYLERERKLAHLEREMELHASDHERLLHLHREHEELVQEMEDLLDEMDKVSEELSELTSTTSTRGS